MLSIRRACAWLSMPFVVSLAVACSASPRDDAPAASGSGAGSGAGSAEIGGGEASGGQGGGIDLCSCPAPLADCNGDPSDGCEVNTSSDATACGGCSPCEQVEDPRADHGEVMCVEGKCKMFCEDQLARGAGCWEIPSYQNCDGIVSNGCETDVLREPKHCGKCGTACAPGTICFEGQCGCPNGYTLCGATCANLDTDASHCGSCDKACPDPDPNDDQVSVCKAGACGTGCNEKCGEFDCDGNPATPCVTLDEPDNCGACGSVCPSGVCQQGLGMAPFCCDESKVGDDVHNCGACGHDCEGQTFNDNWWTVTIGCSAGMCVTTCVPPFGDCDGDPENGCETDIEASTSDCGQCGHVCGKDELCVFGQCAKTCETAR